ncbi:MAG: DUF5696 domain-containing protein [Eubacteriales bacterium]
MLKRILSLLLCMIMLTGAFAGLSVFPVAAAEETTEGEGEEVEILDYTTVVYNTQEEKLATMEKMVEKDGFELWVQKITGEIAVKDQKTGQYLFSNPYDVANSPSSVDTKVKLLSQIQIQYNDGDKPYYFYSYKESALRNQIVYKRIKGGLRVEYTIGREEKRKLVPRMIEKSSFENNILAYVEKQSDRDKMLAYYLLKDSNDPKLTERAKKELMVTYPITETYAIYVFDPTASERELNVIEAIIKTNAPQYTMEMLDADHALVAYEGLDKAPPLFKLSLEYYLDEEGLKVRLPANGIRFDESTYTLAYINALPYMGAGASERWTSMTTKELEEYDKSLLVYTGLDTATPKVTANSRLETGYVFYPDGSGTLIRFEDIGSKSLTITNRIYGPDYSFYKISGNHNENIRMPVFGVITNSIHETGVFEEDPNGEATTEATTAAADAATPPAAPKPDSYEYNAVTEGFLGIIEEGEAGAEISVDCGATLHKYYPVFCYFYPRPTDQYNLDSVSAGSSTIWTVRSRRKYTGNYTLRYMMLSGDKASYAGMANAYREYLLKREMINPIKTAEEDIPLYLEAFGLIHTAERPFGIPMQLKTKLTTFDDAKTMIDTLNEQGIRNINIKYLGWANNGLYTKPPTTVKVESKLGGSSGLTELAAYATEKGATIYPDFNFVMTDWDAPFDGFGYKRDTAKTMDNKTAIEQVYNPALQMFRARGFMIIAPKRMMSFYEQVWKKYEKLKVGAISTVSLGEYLSSDHKRSDPYNRDDSKELTIELLEKIKTDNQKVLLNGGNIFTVKYASGILELPIDSSRFANASEAVPFVGMVLHGTVDYAGTPINMAGDYQYELLKAIENGASPYFVLSYQNTPKLKNTGFYDYYSVDFTTWLSDVVDTYNTLNGALKPVSNAYVVNHEFLNDDGTLVKVEYSNGKGFIINYNRSDAEVDGKTVPALGFVTAG